MAPNPPQTISLIGLGSMGSVLASTLISQSYKTTVWNRTESRAASLVERGAILAKSPAACIAASEIIIFCLITNDNVRDILVPEALDALNGKVIVNLTNGTPSQARDLFDFFTKHGAEYVHGGIMVPPQMIGTPVSFILYSGSEPGFKKAETALGHLGATTFVSETDAGKASLFDLSLLSSMYGLYSGALHALSLVKSSGSSPAKFGEQLLIPFISAMVTHLARLPGQIEAGDYSSDGSPLAMQLPVTANIINTSKEVGVWPGLIGPITELMGRRIAAGGDEEGLGALIKEMDSAKH